MKQPKDKRTKEYKQWLKQQEQVGLGDVVEKITKTTGIKKLVDYFTPEGEDCGCDKRKEKLNKLKIFSTRLKPKRCFTQDEHNTWGRFLEVRTLRLDSEQINFVCKLYADVFKKPFYRPCSSCSPKPLIYMIERLDAVYDSYK